MKILMRSKDFRTVWGGENLEIISKNYLSPDIVGSWEQVEQSRTY